MVWHAHSNGSFGEQWAAYALSWDRVLAEWEIEKYTMMVYMYTILQPAGHIGTMVIGGLMSAIS